MSTPSIVPSGHPVFNHLTEEQLLAVDRAAWPLDPRDRAAFYDAVANELGAGGEIGDGLVYRCVARAQRGFDRPQPPEQPSRWSRGNFV